MKRCLLLALAAMSLAFAASGSLLAQTASAPPTTGAGSMTGQGATAAPAAMAAGMHAPPNILMIETDNIKPYNTTPYDKVAADYVTEARKAKLPGMVIAMEAMSGANRAQYLFAYDSFDDMQKQEDVMMKDANVTAAFAHLDSLEAPYVSEVHNVIWHYREDLSNNAAAADIPHCRFWETITFHIKPGHDEQFEGLMKIVQATYLKIGANIPWATFESEMGATDTYNVIVPMKSLKEEDEGLVRDKAFMDALGSDGMHHMDDVARDAYLSVEDTLWEVNPKTSYVPKEIIDANPAFWAPKPAAPMGKGSMTTSPAAKPAATPPAQ
jgi:hypothetical protein